MLLLSWARSYELGGLLLEDGEHSHRSRLVRSALVLPGGQPWALTGDGRGTTSVNASAEASQGVNVTISEPAVVVSEVSQDVHAAMPEPLDAEVADLTELIDLWRWRITGCSVVTVCASLAVLSSSLFREAARTPSTADKIDTLKNFQGGRRTQGFVYLWIHLALTVGGFAPAYLLKILGHPWYFDTVRQLGAHALPGSVTVHALVGALWIVLLLHQTITAFRGVAHTQRSSHRRVGRLGVVLAFLCSTSGIYILFFGNRVARYSERQPVLLCGIYTFANVLLGVLQVRQKKIEAHKQSMAWAIAWTAWPGLLRAVNWARYLVWGQNCHTQCLNLMAPQVPRFCDLISFTHTQCGMGYKAELSWFMAWGAGVVMWMFFGCSNSEIMVGNSMGFMLTWVSDTVADRAAKELIQGSNWITCARCVR